jgi:membrane protease YdiL (CAAX protease family)
MSFEDLENGKDTESLYSRPDRLRAFLHLVLGIMFFFGSALVLSGVAVGVCSYLLHGEFSDISAALSIVEDLKSDPILLKIFIFISSSLPMIAAAFLVVLTIKATPKDFLMLHLPRNLKWFGLSILFVFVSIPLMGLFLQINELIDFSQWPELYSWLQEQDLNNNALYEAMIGEKNGLSILTSLLFMAFFPALAEELFFRGFLMNVFNGMFKNMHVAIVVTAIIFSVIHLQFTKFLPMMFLAIVFGYAAYWSGSVWTSVLAHFLNNAMAVIQLYFFTDGSYEKALEQGATLPVGASVALLVIVAGLFYYIQNNTTTKTENFYV